MAAPEQGMGAGSQQSGFARPPRIQQAWLGIPQQGNLVSRPPCDGSEVDLHFPWIRETAKGERPNCSRNLAMLCVL